MIEPDRESRNGDILGRLTTGETGAELEQGRKTKSVTVGTMLDNLGPFLSLGVPFSRNGFLHFLKLEQDQGVITVSVGVILDEEIESFFIFAFTNEESRGLRYKLHGDEKVDCRDDLDEVWDTLRSVACHGGQIKALTHCHEVVM